MLSGSKDFVVYILYSTLFAKKHDIQENGDKKEEKELHIVLQMQYFA